MPSVEYFDSIPEDQKRDLAFNIVACVREAISIAQKRGEPPPYERVLPIIHVLSPELYEFCTTQLQSKNENDLTKLYKEKAEAQTTMQDKEVTAEELIQQEIDTHNEMLKQADIEKSKNIKRYILQLYGALENLKPRRLTEHRILERDFIKVDREHLGAEQLFLTDDYVDYKIGANRFLRIRILHPDKPEHILGADLIYERYNVVKETARIAVLQYKVWENGVLNFGGIENRALAQLQKLFSHLCDTGKCVAPAEMAGKVDYRFPYRSAFLRPTDRVQNPDSRMISSGIHVPVCSALEMIAVDGKIAKSELRHTALTHEVFEHLFNNNFLGSRPIHFSQLESFYREVQVLEGSRTLKIYAKEVLAMTA